MKEAEWYKTQHRSNFYLKYQSLPESSKISVIEQEK